jgi:nucleoid DNA-binding protein
MSDLFRCEFHTRPYRQSGAGTAGTGARQSADIGRHHSLLGSQAPEIISLTVATKSALSQQLLESPGPARHSPAALVYPQEPEKKVYMKLKELNEAIASACNVRANLVSTVQAETFRQIRTTLEKGEKVLIPDFGLFVLKESEGEEGAAAKKSIKFRDKSSSGNPDKEKKRAERKEKKGSEKTESKNSETAESDDDED